MSRQESSSLEWVLFPTPPEEFITSYQARLPMRLHRQQKDYYHHLLNSADFDFALHLAIRSRGGVEILDSQGAPSYPRSVSAALEAVNAGRSLRLTAIHRFSMSLNTLRSNLEKAFSCAVNINLYLTPGGGQALSAHYDTHDVLVLQISGEKNWRLLGPNVADPLEYVPLLRGESGRSARRNRRPKIKRNSNLELLEEFTLNAGDVLYLPRGIWHEAESPEGSTSCHLTIGFQVYTYCDLLAVAVAQSAEAIEALRKALPLGFATLKDGRAEMQSVLAQILPELEGKLHGEEALAAISQLFIRSRNPVTRTHLLQGRTTEATPDLMPGSRFTLVHGFALGVESRDEESVLMWNSRSLLVESVFDAACRFLTTASEFTPAELPGISIEQSYKLVRQLIDAGLVVFSDVANATHFKRLGGKSKTSVQNCFPIKIHVRQSQIVWAYFGPKSLNEPFFKQSVKALRELPGGLRVRTTSLRALGRLPEGIGPTGFIFHLSRCGSTLVANAMRTVGGTRVVSEAPAISQVLSATGKNPGYTEDHPRSLVDEELLREIVKAFGQQGDNIDKSLIIKFTSWNILHLDVIRKLWPQVPCLIVLRDPMEVMVSCIAKPPSWMKMKNHALDMGETSLTRKRMDYQDASPERRCAQVIGAYLKAASACVSATCRVIDYSELDKQSLIKVATFLNLETAGISQEEISTVMRTYSKDPTGSTIYTDDTQRPL